LDVLVAEYFIQRQLLHLSVFRKFREIYLVAASDQDDVVLPVLKVFLLELRHIIQGNLLNLFIDIFPNLVVKPTPSGRLIIEENTCSTDALTIDLIEY